MTALIPDFLNSQRSHDAHTRFAVEDQTFDRHEGTAAHTRNAVETNFPGSQTGAEPQLSLATGDQSSTTGQAANADQPQSARGGPTSPVASDCSASNLITLQRDRIPQPEIITDSTPSVTPPRVADPTLALLSDVLRDLESTRIANENRLRQLTRTEIDSDGEDRGFGLDESHPDVARLAGVVEGIRALEHQATLNLQRAVRKHPLGDWIKRTAGVGEKQGARLIATLGDPYWNTLHDRPRTVSELWAYCGVHVVNGAAATRAKGVKSNWNPDAKMRAYLVATSCIKAMSSPYRVVYDEGREKYADAVHPHDCKRCGPAGKPAHAGSPLSAGHQHARAMRLMMKAILKDLWLEAKAIHDSPGGHWPSDAHNTCATGDPVSHGGAA